MKFKSLSFFILDLLTVFFSFLFIAYLKPATLRIYIPHYESYFIYFLLLWIIISLLTGKYVIYKERKISNTIKILSRSNFIILGLTTFILLLFHIFEYSRLMIFGTIFCSFFVEFLLSLVYIFHNKLTKNSDFSEKIFFRPKEIESSENLQDNPIFFEHLSKIENEEDTAFYALKNSGLSENKALFSWINSLLPLKVIEKSETASLKTKTFYNIKNYESESQQLFINIRYINDIREINQFFIQINKNLKQNGIFVGCGVTNKEHYRQFMEKFPPILSSIFYLFDFTFRRVMPKLPAFKEIYFALTKGKNRALSKAEILGRLYFCGFEVYDVTEIDKVLYFIAVKKNSPRKDTNPSYGPLIKLRRVGKNKQLIYIYKFRTMHPYSEYLQSYMYKLNNLEDGGKFKDDFRITTWGKVLRKIWIDELPQFVNLLRGDISLVGVRALSEHYFSLYPKKIQDLRTKFKPGLVPPYYVDIPNSFDEIIESEEKYLLKKNKHALITDIKYFFKAFYNILFKHAHSK